MTEADALRIREWLHVEYEANDNDGLYSNFYVHRYKNERLKNLVWRNEFGYPVGFLVYNMHTNEIDLLSVMESYRNLGIASSLIEEILKTESSTRIALSAANRSYEFWERFGFKIIDGPAAEDNARFGCTIIMVRNPDKNEMDFIS